MNSYRLHIKSDERGPWSCLVRAESVESAIRYGEQVFQNAEISVSRVVSPPRKKPEPAPKPSEISGVWGFSRDELELIGSALGFSAPYCRHEIRQASMTLKRKILRTLEMEITDTGPF